METGGGLLKGLLKEAVYNAGLSPGLSLFRLAKEEGDKGIKPSMRFHVGYRKRPREQVKAFRSSW